MICEQMPCHANARDGILIMGNYPPPYGGIPTHLMLHADWLVTHGWQVHIMSDGPSASSPERPAPHITIYRPVSFTRSVAQALRAAFGVRGSRELLTIASGPVTGIDFLSRFYRAHEICLRGNVKVVSSYKVLPNAVVGATIKATLGTPLVTTIFGEAYSDLPTIQRNRAAVAYAEKHTDAWLSCSDHCAKSIHNYGLPFSPHVRTILYGVDTALFSPSVDGTDVRSTLGVKPQDILVIYVGRMINEMGLGVLLKAIPLVHASDRGIKFLIIGRSGECTPAAKASAAATPEHVFVRENMAYTDLPASYAASDIAVAPSTNSRACLGLSIAEAMACGKPAIGSLVGGTDEVILDGLTGMLVQPNDPNGLASAILSLARNRTYRELLGSAARERAVSTFDKDRTNAELDKLYRTVISKAQKS